MVLSDWVSNLDTAYELYKTAKYSGAIPSATEREDAALQFIQWIEYFKAGGSTAIQLLEAIFRSEDLIRRNVAGYILAEVLDLKKLTDFSNDLTHYGNTQPPISDDILKRFWIAKTPENSDELFWQWSRKRLHIADILLEGMLLRPSGKGQDLFHKILTSGRSKTHSAGLSDTYGIQAIRLVGGWKQPELLRHIIDDPPFALLPIEHQWDDDPRQETAFYLGLMGDQGAIDFLEAIARGLKGFEAAQACRRLALLAQPSAIEPIIKLLHDDNGSVVNIALDAASIMGCTDLIPALLDLMSREIYAEGYHEPLCDDAFLVIRSIIEDPTKSILREEMIEDSYGDYGGILTEAFRQKAADYYRSQFKLLRPVRRYHQGELLTLKHLALDLLSPHWGPFERGGYNLRAITGEDHGLDLSPYSSNFIANMPAILEWKKRAENSEPLEPGGWAFYGNKIDG